MAERPDLEYWIPILHRELAGRTILAVAVDKPVVVRQAVPGSIEDAMVGQSIEAVERHGHFVHLALSSLEVVISPMLAGRFEIANTGKHARKDVAVSLGLDDERELRYRDSVQMGKFYVLPRGGFDRVPGYQTVGIDILDDQQFTLERFVELARKRRDQVRVFLMDKSALDCLGNAYADEVLFAAQIHPKTWTRALDESRLRRLHESIIEVVDSASRTIRERQPDLDVKLRDFLIVRGKHKQPCPRCSTPIRKAGVRGFDSYFCPRCQPPTRKTSIVSWDKA